MKKNKKDILTLKTMEYEAAAKEAENAVSVVHSAMNSLKVANQKMHNNMEYIESYCSNMMALHAQLEKNCNHNEAVIANFNKLLCVEEDN